MNRHQSMAIEYAQVLLIDREARFKEASQYILNTQLQMECRLLEKQIAALKRFIKENKRANSAGKFYIV